MGMYFLERKINGFRNRDFQKHWNFKVFVVQLSFTIFEAVYAIIAQEKRIRGCFPSIWVSISNIYFPLVRGLHYCTSLYKINRSGAVRIFSIRLCIISASKKKIRSFIKTFAKTPGQNTISFLTSRRVMCSF